MFSLFKYSDQIIAFLRDGILPVNDDALAKKVIIQSDNYMYVDGLLFHFKKNRKKDSDQLSETKQLVVPRAIRDWILHTYHNLNHHIGSDKLYDTTTD